MVEGIAKVGTPICVPGRVSAAAWLCCVLACACLPACCAGWTAAGPCTGSASHPALPPLLNPPSHSTLQGGVDLGRISSLEKDHKPVDTARRGDSVAMKIEVSEG